MGKINRRELAKRIVLSAFAMPSAIDGLAETTPPATTPCPAHLSQTLRPHWKLVLPGIWKGTFGPPKKFSPVALSLFAPSGDALDELPGVAAGPVSETAEVTRRGCTVRMPLDSGE